MALRNARICRNVRRHAQDRECSPVRVGSPEGTDLVVHLLQQRPDIVAVASDPSLKFPVLDGFWTANDLRERIVDPEQLVTAEVHVLTIGGHGRAAAEAPSFAATSPVLEICGRLVS